MYADLARMLKAGNLAYWFLLAMLEMALLISSPAMASDTAGVRGIVQGASGTPISAAQITAQNLATGLRRTTTSNAEGQFEIGELPAGTYQIQIARSGFVSRSQESVKLDGSQTPMLTLILDPVAGSKEQVGQGSDNGTDESSTTGDQISESQLAGLPLNGRSYSQLATLQSGVSDAASTSSARGTSGGGLTVSGGRSTSNVFLLDGTNIMNSDNQVPRSAAGVQLGSDAVLQVQVSRAE